MRVNVTPTSLNQAISAVWFARNLAFPDNLAVGIDDANA